jgi:hypothetical protein
MPTTEGAAVETPIDSPARVRASAGLRALLERLDAEFGPVAAEIREEVDAELHALFGLPIGDAGTDGPGVRNNEFDFQE